MMAEFEVGEAGNRELIKRRREIKEYAELFFKENPSRVKFIRELDRLIDRAAELDFLEKVESHDLADEEKFRVKKIIKARVNNEALENFKQQLAEHAAGRI
jgi:Na+/phosphate symporter